MKAAVLTALNKDLEIRDDVGLAELKPGEVQIKLVASGVCHSDLSAQNGTIPVGMPCVLGHEGAGIVKAVGPGVTEVKPGDPAIIAFTPACRRCKPCLRGQANLCTSVMQMMMTPHFVIDGKPVSGMAGCGTFADEMIVPENAVIPVDKSIPLNVAALIGCGVMTGVGAAINTAQIKPGSSVIVFGAGGVGIAAIQGARIAGAAEIVAVDMVDSKLEQAMKFGATHAVKPDGVDSAKASVTGGEGFDYAIECVGRPELIRKSFDVTRRGGTAVIVGVGRLTEEVKFNAFEMFYHEKNLKGSMFGSANVRLDFDRLLRLWKYGKLDLEGMISRRIKLAEVNEAFGAMQRGEVIRSVIEYS
jgi:S-(hydroxymethyl)glutathione dehydrogenase/alcohol dehydrogenase